MILGRIDNRHQTKKLPLKTFYSESTHYLFSEIGEMANGLPIPIMFGSKIIVRFDSNSDWNHRFIRDNAIRICFIFILFITHIVRSSSFLYRHLSLPLQSHASSLLSYWHWNEYCACVRACIFVKKQSMNLIQR